MFLQKDYYQMVAILQQFDGLFNQLQQLVNAIDPMQLPITAVGVANPGQGVTGNAPVLNQPGQPYQPTPLAPPPIQPPFPTLPQVNRPVGSQPQGTVPGIGPVTGAPSPVPTGQTPVTLNTPVLHGPLADLVGNMVAQKQIQEQRAQGIIARTVPYDVDVISVYPDNHRANHFWARVRDTANAQESLIAVDKDMYDEYTQDPNGLRMELGQDDLKKMIWDDCIAPQATAHPALAQATGAEETF